MSETLRPVRSWRDRTAWTTYSELIWMSTVARAGNSTVHQSMPAWRRTWTRPNPKSSAAVDEVPWTSRTSGRAGSEEIPSGQPSAVSRATESDSSGGPGGATPMARAGENDDADTTAMATDHALRQRPTPRCLIASPPIIPATKAAAHGRSYEHAIAGSSAGPLIRLSRQRRRQSPGGHRRRRSSLAVSQARQCQRYGRDTAGPAWPATGARNAVLKRAGGGPTSREPPRPVAPDVRHPGGFGEVPGGRARRPAERIMAGPTRSPTKSTPPATVYGAVRHRG